MKCPIDGSRIFPSYGTPGIVPCSYCHLYDNDLAGAVEVTPDGGRAWQRQGVVCARCRAYLTGHWRKARA